MDRLGAWYGLLHLAIRGIIADTSVASREKRFSFTQALFYFFASSSPQLFYASAEQSPGIADLTIPGGVTILRPVAFFCIDIHSYTKIHGYSMQTISFEETRWLDLSAAANYLGVHFTTLRRWTDAGEVPCIRTPGGRRRYRLAELTSFLASLQQGEIRAPGPEVAGPGLTSLLPPKNIALAAEPWYGRLDETMRATMRHGGQQLMAVLMQYATRSSGGEAFLEEGQRLASAYGEASHKAGLTLIETLHAFLLVRRSINDSVHQAGALAGAPDAETWRLYDRIATFLDAMLISTVTGFEQAQR